MRSPSDEVLYKDKWIELRKKDDWYTYAHNVVGDGVAVLGFRRTPSGIPGVCIWEVMVRSEHTPPHGEGFRLTSLTGSIEHGLSPLETAAKELKEESGYEINSDSIIDLGWVYPSKFSDYRQYLYAVDLTGLPQGRIEGDGTEGEKGASVGWFSVDFALEVNDPSISASIARLANKGRNIL